VPNGGYVASVLLSAAQMHFGSTLSHLDQPDTMSMQLQFLRRTRSGAGTVSIHHMKLGGSISVIQATLSQDGREEVQGYLTQTNFTKQRGISLPTKLLDAWLSPAPPAVDFAQLEKHGEDANWQLQQKVPFADFRKATRHIMFHHPKVDTHPSCVDQWVRFRPGGAGHPTTPWSNEALGYVVDIFPMVVERFPQDKREARWYPTVALNIDIKRRLPPEGVDWLFVRAMAGEIRDGRLDLQVVVLDQSGNLVAFSSHITLILSADRNTKRSTPESKKDGKSAKI
jgi:hypothetical protein